MKDDTLTMEFNDFYERKIKPNLLELEQERKKLCVRLLKSNAIAALAFPGGFLAVWLPGCCMQAGLPPLASSAAAADVS